MVRWTRWGFLVAAVWVATMLVPVLAESPDEAKRRAVHEKYAGYKKDFPMVKDIHPLAAKELLAQGRVVFVDTREEEEMAVSKLPGAYDEAGFLALLEADPNHFAGKTVVAYCTISYRSGKFAERMAARGVEIQNLAGGILAWVFEGGKVYDPRGRETRVLHVYGEEWNMAPSGFKTVMFGWWDRLFR